MPVNQEMLTQLMSMGFGQNRCIRALKETGNRNVDSAAEWLFMHMDEVGIDDPVVEEEEDVVMESAAPPDEPQDPAKAAELSQLLQPYLGQIKVPTPGDRIYRDECLFTFDTPETEGGLYVCLQTFRGMGRRVLNEYHATTGQTIFLNIRRKKIPLEPEPEQENAPKVIVVGPAKPKYRVEEELTLHVMPQDTALCTGSDPNLPVHIRQAVQKVMAGDSAARLDEVAQWTEKRQVSKFASDLKQLDNGVKVPPSGHKCARCDLTNNLWLNLTDGTILCGRKNYDGSGGNNHAVEYYAETKYPLAVKLGTITPDGADVYSYAEDDMVEDPNLAQHLAHFGIDVMSMEKTEKTMAELELEQNMKHEWALIQETGHSLTPLYGPGYTGMHNLGNSCYMASVLQTCMALPPFQQAYMDARPEILAGAWGKRDASDDFHVQMSKLADGLLSGCYSTPPQGTDATHDDIGIRPLMFKTLIGRGHPEFSTMRQQDALEFFQYLMETIRRKERAITRGDVDPSDAFRFEFEERLVCGSTGQVRYSPREDNILSLGIPLDQATNIAEVTEYQSKVAALKAEGKPVMEEELPIVRPRVPLDACLQVFGAPERLSDWVSPATGSKTTAEKTVRFKSYPQYLLVHVRRFYLSDDWTPHKLDVAVSVPEDLDLSALKGSGMQPGEVALPDNAPAPPPAVDPEETATVEMLMTAGFGENACKKAYQATKGQGADAAMDWLLQRLDDPTINDPIPSANQSQAGPAASEEDVAMLTSMGFSVQKAQKALAATSNNVERAVDWLVSHADEPDEVEGGKAADANPSASGCRLANHNGRYTLIGFISHMGTSTACGHYVCHVKKEGRYVLFNDEKVAVSEEPPRDFGYLYVYRRVD
eukprot:comp24172_c0_seq1/m.44156 comp24172_c0_seq1/g.44156  ORF comp24172_c0_seq1/g.44156 comp24172_c0_seq1/m.44156 type:complete len:877 (-) comp24172_c0_seq1:625-3255(-)